MSCQSEASNNPIRRVRIYKLTQIVGEIDTSKTDEELISHYAAWFAKGCKAMVKVEEVKKTWGVGVFYQAPVAMMGCN